MNYARQTYEIVTKTLLPLPLNTPIPELDAKKAKKFAEPKTWNVLFRTSKDHFDLLIELNPHVRSLTEKTMARLTVI